MEVRRSAETYFHLTTEQVRRYNLVRIYKSIYDWSIAPPACQFDWSFLMCGSGLNEVMTNEYHGGAWRHGPGS